MEIRTPVDGNNTFGFPFTFLLEYGGKRRIPPKNPVEIYYGYLIVDMIIASSIAYILEFMIRQLKTRKGKRFVTKE